MKKLICIWLAVFPILGYAAEEGDVHLDKVRIDLADKAALQSGAKYFVNYCTGCHSVNYMRYSRLARDLGLTERQVMDNLNFTDVKFGNTMTIAMPADDASKWFGTVPPDLSLVARSRGVDWLYTYLRTFYVDETRPFGVNNVVFKDVGMPHVLWQLQGLQKAVYKEVVDEAGNTHNEFDHLEPISKGSMDRAAYDKMVRDLVTFLAYMGEPVKVERQGLGIKVLLFLIVFFVVAYLLKKEYWKDIH
jgi:ubiquinol-cytochrome c reductase cytochrome c1 subunit